MSIDEIMRQDTAVKIQSLENQLAAGQDVRQARLARLDTIRKCLNILLDGGLTKFAVRGDVYLRHVINRATHKPNVFTDTIAESLRSAQEIIDQKPPSVHGSPDMDLQAVVTKLMKAIYHSNNAFDSNDDSLKLLIDSYSEEARQKQSKQVDDPNLLTSLDRAHPAERSSRR